MSIASLFKEDFASNQLNLFSESNFGTGVRSFVGERIKLEATGAGQTIGHQLTSLAAAVSGDQRSNKTIQFEWEFSTGIYNVANQNELRFKIQVQGTDPVVSEWLYELQISLADDGSWGAGLKVQAIGPGFNTGLLSLDAIHDISVTANINITDFPDIDDAADINFLVKFTHIGKVITLTIQEIGGSQRILLSAKVIDVWNSPPVQIELNPPKADGDLIFTLEYDDASESAFHHLIDNIEIIGENSPSTPTTARGLPFVEDFLNNSLQKFSGILTSVVQLFSAEQLMLQNIFGGAEYDYLLSSLSDPIISDNVGNKIIKVKYGGDSSLSTIFRNTSKIIIRVDGTDPSVTHWIYTYSSAVEFDPGFPFDGAWGVFSFEAQPFGPGLDASDKLDFSSVAVNLADYAKPVNLAPNSPGEVNFLLQIEHIGTSVTFSVVGLKRQARPNARILVLPVTTSKKIDGITNNTFLGPKADTSMSVQLLSELSAGGTWGREFGSIEIIDPNKTVRSQATAIATRGRARDYEADALATYGRIDELLPTFSSLSPRRKIPIHISPDGGGPDIISPPF